MIIGGSIGSKHMYATPKGVVGYISLHESHSNTKSVCSNSEPCI